jgi:uncharacterized protein (DUF433 family)
MELENYFEFIGEHTIRIACTRVGIETVLRDYWEGASPEEIVLRYPTLSLEQVYATITYYLANREKVETYLKQVRQQQEEAWQEQQQKPNEFVRALRERLQRYRTAQHQGEPLPACRVCDADRSAFTVAR